MKTVRTHLELWVVPVVTSNRYVDVKLFHVKVNTWGKSQKSVRLSKALSNFMKRISQGCKQFKFPEYKVSRLLIEEKVSS